MKNALSTVFSLSLLILPTFGQGTERGMASAEFTEGKTTISYGIPTWNEKFKAEMKDGFVWRCGNNDPTNLEAACGIACNEGAVPPGSYKIALRFGADNKANLLIYAGTSFYAEGLKTWTIAPTAMKMDSAPVDKLAIAINKEAKTLDIKFGPFAATYPVVPIAVQSCETNFANVSATFRVLQLPIAADAVVKNMHVGTATGTMSGQRVSYDLLLTMDGEKPILSFVNDRSPGIAKEKAVLEQRIQRIKGRLEKATTDEDKTRLGKAVTDTMESVANLDKEAAANARLQPKMELEGTFEAREKPVAAIDFSHDRPTGSIVLKFGAQNRTALFDVKPRAFQNRGAPR